MPDILVIGIGGAGNTIIDKRGTTRSSHVKTVAVDTDKQVLDSMHASSDLMM